MMKEVIKMENMMCLEFVNNSENESFARMVATAFVTHLNPTLEEIVEIKTAISEAVTNAIIHGYANQHKGIVKLKDDGSKDKSAIKDTRGAFMLPEKVVSVVGVYEIGGFNTVYINNKVNDLQTFADALRRNPTNIKVGYENLYKKARQLRPDVIVTDFEIYATMLSKIRDIPLISLDNIHMITQTRIDYPKNHFAEMLKAKGVIKTYVVNPKIHILTSFFYPRVRPGKHAVIYPPVIREDILKLTPTQGDHIIVYQTSRESEKLVQRLKALKDEKFIVYGFNKDETDGNLCYKPFNEDEFYDDLASSKAVICNGGFTFITEAIHLKKPIYSVPAIGNFEQTLNGFYVQKLGYGEYHEIMSAERVADFLKRLAKYQEKLDKVKKTNNDGIIRELIYRIEKYSKLK